MSTICFHQRLGISRLKRRRILYAAALPFALSVALPVSAADARAIKSRVPPIYPEIAKRMRISGQVKVEATVSPRGK